MSARYSAIATWFIVLSMACIGGLIGGGIRVPDYAARAVPCPLPHHVPKYPGVASLRFAMVHDVVTERYPKHGRGYFEERNRVTRLALQDEETRMGDKPSPRYFELIDDLASGLDQLGQHADSIPLMRDKLKRQLELGQQGMELYSTYANLGTFIILWEIQDGLADKKKARAGLEEGLKLIRQAIAINPRSHFGREIWQAVILEYLLAILDDPELPTKFDMVGNSLEATPFRVRSHQPKYWGRHCRAAHEYLAKPSTEQDMEKLSDFRGFITRIKPAHEWETAVKSSHRDSVPFDEPTLGIIGMWRIGGGPNPFFAVALGEIMLRVGQSYNAWNAFERAYRMGDGVGNEAVSQKFKEHCRNRQKWIEDRLSEEERGQLRPSFDMHLAKGLAYQKAYQAYEAIRIKEGASLDDPHFYDAFDAEQGSIASPVGDEDRIDETALTSQFTTPMILLGAGVGACLGALFIRWLCWMVRKGYMTESKPGHYHFWPRRDPK